MITQIVIFIMVGLFGLYSAVGLLIWCFAVTIDLIASYRKAVDFLSLASSVRRTMFTGIITTLSSVFTMTIWWSYVLSMQHPDFRWLLILFVVLIGLFAVLWFATFFLRLQTRRRPYLYLLPEDADDLRLRQCKQGVMIAATFYPKILTDADQVDTMSRASSVEMRYNVFPKLKRGLKTLKLTNDFTVYCNVCAEGYIQGYYGFVKAIQAAPDHLEAQRAILEEWPETEESQRLMDALAPQFL